ncbi:N-alpha-acetyltransferase 16, NatA auxiliary subunit, partial [Haplosporangium sp. Z 27]
MNEQYLTVEDIASRLVLDVDVHYAPTRVISLENTLNGTIMPIEEMARIRQLTQEHDIKLHLDGARLWHASIATGISMKEYCSHFDTISLCLSKGIGAPIGSILVGSKTTIKKARHFRLLFGGAWRQAGFLAEAALWCIKTNWPTMEDTHRQARWLERALKQVGCHITNPVDTNMIWIDTSDTGFTVEELIAELAKERIKISGSGYAARIVLHYQISDDAVEKFIEVLRKMASTPRMKVAVDLTRASMIEQPSSIYVNGDEASPTTPAPQAIRDSDRLGQERRLKSESCEDISTPMPNKVIHGDEATLHCSSVESSSAKTRCLFDETRNEQTGLPSNDRFKHNFLRPLQTSLSSPSSLSQQVAKCRPMSAFEPNVMDSDYLNGADNEQEIAIQYQSHFKRNQGPVIRRTQSLDLAETMQEQAAYKKALERPQVMDSKKVNKLQYRLAHNPASKALRRATKCYEMKQYKLGFKEAEQILKKFPEHGETLAMKGLFYNHMDKKEEAYEFVKKGLRFNLKSHICWHVLGLVYRSDKNYEEASKCYINALKFDKFKQENIQILRDLSLLRMQMRSLEGYIETRHELLELRPQNRQYWVAVAIGYQLTGRPELGVKVLTAYEETLKDIPSTPDYEHSEMLLYHNTLLEEVGDIEVALDHLNTIESHVCDRKNVKERRAKYLLALGRLSEAESAYRDLLSVNPDNMAYFEGLRKSIGLGAEQLSAEEQVKLLELFGEFQKEYPRSNAAKRLPLRYATGEAFVKIADEYIRNMLRKGVPSLFVNIKTLYADKEKEQAVEKLVLGYLTALDKSKGFDHSGSNYEPPTALLWTLYFLAQHFDFKRSTDQAIGYIDRAIEHTPTLVELYMTKGRILKHAGDHIGAMKALDEARELDLQDRFINTKCTKYMLRADKMAEAEKTVVLFTRADIVNPLNDLVEMQAIWFSLAAGESHLRQKQIGRALKRFHQINKHFLDYIEDQFDFHTYCLRKMTLRAYVSLIRLEDQLRSHPFYVKAAHNAIECYINIFDNPEGADTEEMEGMTEAEKKKYRNKQRKAELKAQQEAEDLKKKAISNGDATKKANTTGNVDDDPEGTKYTKVADPLAEALKFLKPLQELASERIETHLHGFNIYIRQNKLLLALRSLLKAHKIEPNNPVLHEQLVRFAITFQKASPKPSIKAVIDQHW